MLTLTLALAHSTVLVAATLAALVAVPSDAAPQATPLAVRVPLPPPVAPPPPPPVVSPTVLPPPRAAVPVVVATRPAARLTAAPRASAPARRVTPKPAPTRTVTAPRRPAQTAQQRLDSAVARIPGYRSHQATWVITDRYGSWGTADWYTDRIYISPRVTPQRLFDVVVHEWSHLRSVDAYGGDVEAAVAEMNRWFGGTGLHGAELAADCMARQLGATWTNYTSCPSDRARAGAAALLAGKRLPS